MTVNTETPSTPIATVAPGVSAALPPAAVNTSVKAAMASEAAAPKTPAAPKTAAPTKSPARKAPVKKSIINTSARTAVPAAAAPKAPATQKTAAPAPAKSPARKAPVKKAIVTTVPAKKAPLKMPATKELLPKILAVKLITAALIPNGKKPKLIRDSFTIPKAEYVVLDELKQRAAALTRPAKKSEVLRAGIKILDALSDSAFLAALAQVPTVKTGRPAHKK